MMIGVWVAVSMGMDPWQDMGGRLQNVLCGCQLFGVENGCKKWSYGDRCGNEKGFASGRLIESAKSIVDTACYTQGESLSAWTAASTTAILQYRK